MQKYVTKKPYNNDFYFLEVGIAYEAHLLKHGGVTLKSIFGLLRYKEWNIRKNSNNESVNTIFYFFKYLSRFEAPSALRQIVSLLHNK